MPRKKTARKKKVTFWATVKKPKRVKVTFYARIKTSGKPKKITKKRKRK
jgi:hypothetical protein